MWRIFLLVFLVHISSLVGRPLEETHWQSTTLDIPQHLQDLLRQLFNFKTDEEREKEDPLERVSGQVKRGFSIFARMRPFNSMVKQRTSIRHPGRSINPYDPLGSVDIVSAEKHAHNFRPVGQPLRWG